MSFMHFKGRDRLSKIFASRVQYYRENQSNQTSNVVFSIKIPGNPRKMFVNNQTLQKPISE